MLNVPPLVILILVLTGITCVIAVWSDNLGKKLGKRRISLFGLRPRQTATVITVASSVGIMILTLVGLTLFSRQVRDMLLHSEQYRAENKELRQNNLGLQNTSRQLKQSVQSSRQRANDAVRHAAAATLRAHAITLAANNSVAGARQRIVLAQSQLTRATARLIAATRGRDDALRGKQFARQQADAAERSLDAAKINLGDVNDKLAQARASFKKDNAKSLVVFRAKLMQIMALERRQLSLQQNVKALHVEATQLKADYEFFRQTASSIATGQVIIDLGQTFAEVVVPPGADETRLRDSISRLLDAGAQAARKMGGVPFPDPASGVMRALHLAPIQMVDNGPALTEQQLIDYFVKYIDTKKVPVSVRLVAARRYVQGETTFEARLIAVPVTLVYHRGDTVAELVIDGSQTDAKIFHNLLHLSDMGGDAARAHGVNPLLTADNPDFYVAETPERIFTALRALQARGETVRVRLVAADDALTVDHLDVRFVLDAPSQ